LSHKSPLASYTRRQLPHFFHIPEGSTLGNDLVADNQAHRGTVPVKPQAMSSALANKTSAALAALPPIASRAGHTRHIHVSQLSTHHRFSLRPNAATQLRHIGGYPGSRPQGPATASEKPASAKKEGRLSVLDRMGANRTTKIVIIVFLSIYGTMETIFYANAAYRYFSKEESE
jgi:hypothetical protein